MTETQDPGPRRSPPPGVIVREQEYGDRVVGVEPGGVEFIPFDQRHGRPRKLFWTWTSPNLEFSTVFLGVLAVAVFKLSFWQAAAAIVVGTVLGSIPLGVLSARGPRYGVAQMVLGRVPFGYRGNILPATLNAVTAGIGWFAVNSVSATFALNTLTGLPKSLCLAVVVVVEVAIAFFGHNLVHAFARYAFPVLAVVFAVGSVIILFQADFGAHPAGGGGGLGGFLAATSAAFGYAGAWSSCAADYSRYLPADTNRRAVGLSSGLGVLLGCAVLEIVGAASATIGSTALTDPTGAYTGHMPALVGALTLLAITLGAISANVLNLYSGALSFVTLSLKLPFPLTIQRAAVVMTFGVIGLVVAYFGLRDVGQSYEAFLLVIAYWIGPWLGVVLTDQYLRRRERTDSLLFDATHRNLAGPIAMLAGLLLSVWLFSDQQAYVGVVPSHIKSFGDITFAVGFAIAAASYAAFRLAKHRERSVS